MESRVKLLGHPIHPMLVVLPLGLLSVGLLFDVVYLVGGDPVFSQVAYWDILLGVIGGLAAAVFGVIDWFAIPGSLQDGLVSRGAQPRVASEADLVVHR